MTRHRCRLHDCLIDVDGCQNCLDDAALEAAEAREAAELNDGVVDVEIVWEVDVPGWWPDMPEDVYHGDPVPSGSLSSTMAKVLVQPGGPAKLRELTRTPRPDKPAFDLGHAVHRLALGVGAELALIPFDEWRTKEAKQAVADARDAGKIPLKPVDYDRAHRMAEALAAHEYAAALLTSGAPEVSGFHRTDDGLWLRARFDWVGPDYLVDVKTAAAADPDSFARDAAKFGYHIQRAHYEAVAQALGLPHEQFLFIVQEKTAPYLVSVIELDADYVDIGRTEWERAVELWARCRADDDWPGYEPHTVTVTPPAWLRYRAAGPGHDATSETPTHLDPAIEAAFAELIGETL